MNVRKLLIPITCLLLSATLAGCGSTRQLEISASPIEKPLLTLPEVSKLNSRDVKWIIVNKDNVNQVLADLEKRRENVVLFALTDKGYEALSLNTSDLRKLIMQQQALIAAYRRYYEDSQSAMDTANGQIELAKKQGEVSNDSGGGFFGLFGGQ